MRFILSYVLYGVGDLCCRVLELNDDSERWVSFWYPIYNWFMGTSNRVQGAGDGPWERW